MGMPTRLLAPLIPDLPTSARACLASARSEDTLRRSFYATRQELQAGSDGCASASRSIEKCVSLEGQAACKSIYQQSESVTIIFAVLV